MQRQARELEKILGEQGILAKVLDVYDWRPQQLEMGNATLEALARDQILLVEAPTGVGKTMAYLVPAALYARARREPVVISSYTKALQDQILRQETPRLLRVVHPDLRVCALKGRSNYLCRRRWELFLAEEGSGPDGHWVLERLQEWVFGTASGDFSEAPDLGARAAWVRARIGGDAHFCRSRLCRADDGCFHKAARRVARESELVLVNHSLLLADALSPGILPEYGALIIDEAHLLPEAAIDPLTREVSAEGMLRRVRLLGGSGDPGASDRMRRLLRATSGRVAARNATRRLRGFEEAARGCLDAGQQCFRSLGATGLFPATGERRRCPASSAEVLFSPEAERFLDILEATLTQGEELLEEIENTSAARASSPEAEALREGAAGQFEELREAAVTLRDLLRPQPGSRVHVLETSASRGLVVSAMPISAGPEIRSHLLDRCSSVVLTSATLAAGDDLSFFVRAMGLERGEARTLSLASPFPLAQQLRVIVPSYAVDPRQAGYEAALAGGIRDILGAVQRKTLVLFTAHETLERVEDLLHGSAELDGWELIAQSRGVTKEQIGERFRRASRAVLLGTAGFWYGMDFPGSELEVLVVTRLPFPVPTDPRVAALSERLEAEGRSHFREEALPEAVLRFRQGLGRLIRRRTDHGACIVLDPRIIHAAYGAQFRDVLPAPPVVVDTPAELKSILRQWFAAGR